jgi:hypothetical protein
LTIAYLRYQRRQRAAADNIPGFSGGEFLRFPLRVPARLAILAAKFQANAQTRVFDSSDLGGLLEYAPEALAMPLNPALSLADRKLRGLIDLPSLKSAIVVLSSANASDGGPLAGHHRDLLWKAFGLPVFDQLRGLDGRVVARECEVHDGLHFDIRDVKSELPPDFRIDIDNGHCDCGSDTPRLRHIIVTRSRAAAA